MSTEVTTQQISQSLWSAINQIKLAESEGSEFRMAVEGRLLAFLVERFVMPGLSEEIQKDAPKGGIMLGDTHYGASS